MSTDIDFIKFTTLRFRNAQFEDILPQLQDMVAKDYRAKGVTANAASIHLHSFLADTVVIDNVIIPEDSIAQCYPKLYVDQLCAASVLRGADIFAAGVVGMEPEVLTSDTGGAVSVFACLGKFNAGFKRTYDGAARFLGNGRLLMPARQLLGDLHAYSGVAVAMTEPICVCPSFQSDLFTSGRLVPQNLPSLICARVLDPQPGDLVLDMCAAPGGKCLHLADLMGQLGRIIAIDKSAKRLKSVSDSAARLGISRPGFLQVHCYDSCYLCDINGNDASNPSGLPPPYRPGQFDRILLDAPCSALGQRPRLSVGAVASDEAGKEKLLNSFPPLQRRLLRVASQLLKPGGTLVYSTCTTRPAENESQAAWLLDNCHNLRLAEQTPNLRPLTLLPGSADVQKFSSTPGAFIADSCPWDFDTIGFFIAKFVSA